MAESTSRNDPNRAPHGRISPEQMAAVRRMQAYWMSRIGPTERSTASATAPADGGSARQQASAGPR